MLHKFFLFAALTLLLFSCTEEPVGQQPLDSVVPGPVSNVTVKNVSGGAVLKFTLPEDEDLLYVKAVYFRKDGVESEARTSEYVDTLLVQGFGDTSIRDVKVIAVDRSRNESPAVLVQVEPLEPAVSIIGKTLDLVPDFGGVHAYWTNALRSEISVVVLKKDQNNEYVPISDGTFYSSMVIGSGAVRGMDTIPEDFGVFVQDRWENRSEVKLYTLTPIYETLFDRNKFQSIDLPTDATVGAGWVKQRMFDGQKGENGYSSQGGSGVWPQWVTIDLGVTGKISRLRLFQRTGNNNDYIFGEGNPKEFEIWGCTTLDMSGSWDSWTKLMDCRSIKPSGLPITQNTNEDVDRAVNGEDFINAPTNPNVRYIRIKVTRTWAGGDNFQISELAVYGDNRQ